MNTNAIKIFEDIFYFDQQAIKDFRAGKIRVEDLVEAQRENSEKIKDLIKEQGFPFINISSEKAYKAAFLSIQHSDDIKLIEQTAELFSGKTDAEIVRGDMAYLIDRARIFQNQPQVYGTQFKKIDGQIEFFEIEDIKNLDTRRKNLGMTSFEEYKKMIV